MLKKTEGVVVLLVCNPNKKDDSGSTGAPALEEPPPPGTPARPGSTTPAKPGTTTPAKTESTLKGPTHISRPNTPAGKLSLASPAKGEPFFIYLYLYNTINSFFKWKKIIFSKDIPTSLQLSVKLIARFFHDYLPITEYKHMPKCFCM